MQARGVLVGKKIVYDSGVLELHILRIRDNFRNLTEIRWQEGGDKRVGVESRDMKVLGGLEK